MKILIIEDEPLVANDLLKTLNGIVPELDVLGVLTSVEDSKKWFVENGQPDLILADIQLSDGISFEIFESLALNCPIIFTTAYDDFAIRAFKLNSIDYLLKPIDKVELEAALHKHKLRSEKQSSEELTNFIRQWKKGEKNYKERFLVFQGNALVPVVKNEVGYFQKDQLIFLYSMKNERFVCDNHALDELEGLLDPAIFFRVNRQFIIHIQSVSKLKTTAKGLTVILKSPLQTEIDVSREKATAFKTWLG